MTPEQQQLQIIRDGLLQHKTHFAGMAQLLSEPYRGLFLNVSNDLNEALTKLPLTEAVPLALAGGDQLRAMFSSLCSACTLATSLQSAYDGLKNSQGSALMRTIKQISLRPGERLVPAGVGK